MDVNGLGWQLAQKQVEQRVVEGAEIHEGTDESALCFLVLGLLLRKDGFL